MQSVESNPGMDRFCFTSFARLFLNQSDAKLKPITTWPRVFSRPSGSFVFTLSCHWLFCLLSFFLIGRSDNFGFSFTTLIQ